MDLTSPTNPVSTRPPDSTFFLPTKVGSYDPGIYSRDEINKMPDKVRRSLQTVSSALREGLIGADMGSAERVDDLDFFAPQDNKSKEPVKMHGVKEGFFDKLTHSVTRPTKDIKPSDKKIDNRLRSALKKSSNQEDSLKAKIEAAKAAKSSAGFSHPSDRG